MSSPPALICLSHLRWNFVYQRPQHLMTRCAADRPVFFFEEPILDAPERPFFAVESHGRVRVLTPHLPPGLTEAAADGLQRRLLDELIASEAMQQYVLWYYTPMALRFTAHLSPVATVYDCMDELSAFVNAPADLKAREAELIRRATFMLTGGPSLYEAKKHLHPSVHAFPSSVDVAHFAQARTATAEPDDQSAVPHPRLGFFGVIDERMDLELLDAVATARPHWQLVMLGPVVKIDPDVLPRRSNIHYFGSKAYAELPAYLSGWDVALLPFARNAATRFISPTKTPEYLAAGVPVVSTSIRDVVRPYGERGLARIADAADDFVQACEAAMGEDRPALRRLADAFLRQTSWDGTWTQIRNLLDAAIAARLTAGAITTPAGRSAAASRAV